jgi:ATP-dependent exoDNAse (exonuclease V) alpha subunit
MTRENDLNNEQQDALVAIVNWLEGPYTPFFKLEGGAGTGKTFCIRRLVEMRPGAYVFTAPTNKATKVLKDSVSTPAYTPLCRTIYSLLGLKLSNDGEVKEVKAPKDHIKLKYYDLVIVDEAFMINAQLFKLIEEAALRDRVRFLFMGDSCQLNPIGEKQSKVCDVASGATLTRVMRFDNQILVLATKLREEVDKAEPYVKLESDHSDGEGVWRLVKNEFEEKIKEYAEAGLFSIANNTKVIAWRNIRVNYFNKLIRDIILPGAPAWTIGDRVIFASPIRDEYDALLAAIDDEGVVTSVDLGMEDGFKIWLVEVEIDEGRIAVARVLHEDSEKEYQDRLRDFASEARSRERKWQDFWNLKEQFNELKYAYAITAHRAQGSTYENVFVCWQDILRNPDVQEAYRCLLVAATRPKKRLLFS